MPLRTLRQALLFLLVTAVLYVATVFVLYHVRIGGNALLYRCGGYYQGKGGITYAKFRELRPDDRYDVMVIGSSHAYRGYAPHLFAERGLRLFNLGTSAQPPMNSYYVLKNYVDKRNCGLLLFDLYENTMGRDALESTSDLTRNITSERAALEMGLASKDPRSVNLLTLRWLSHNEPATRVDNTYRTGGYAERTDSLRTAVQAPAHGPLVLDSMQVRYLRKCIAYCRTEGIPLVLVSHYYPDASDHARHAAFHAFIQREIAGTGIRYIDLAYAGRVDDRDHFYDQNHLNAAGVQRFNAQLLDSLAAYGIIPR